MVKMINQNDRAHKAHDVTDSVVVADDVADGALAPESLEKEQTELLQNIVLAIDRIDRSGPSGKKPSCRRGRQETAHSGY